MRKPVRLPQAQLVGVVTVDKTTSLICKAVIGQVERTLSLELTSWQREYLVTKLQARR